MSTGSSRSPGPGRGPSVPQNQNAALQGASLAFTKPIPKPDPRNNDYSGRGEALAAATKAGSGSPPKNVSKSTYKGRDGEESTSSRGGSLEPHRQNRLEPGDESLHHSKSASFIAASLAASRSVTPNHTEQSQSSQGQKQISNSRHLMASAESLNSREMSNHDLDTASIAPTTSLIDQFEQRRVTPTNQPGGGSDRKRSSTNTTQKSWNPEPQKSPLVGAHHTSSPVPAKPRRQTPEIEPPKPISSVASSGRIKPTDTSKSVLVSHATSVPAQQQVKSPRPPKPLLTTTKPPAISPNLGLPSPETRSTPTSATKPTPTQSKLQAQRTGDSYVSSDDSFVSASDVQPSVPPRRHSVTPHHHLTPSPSVTVDSLANAIVASSLASSRAASPAKPSITSPPLPPPRRNTRGRMFRNNNDSSRTPSPGKGSQTSQLRTTMRKPKEEDVNENVRHRRRRNIVKKHPHKHHEGDRKRWRDEITERERKRYEAVWASNKGMYNPATPEGGSEVCNIVVRDIWNRSRLPPEVLEEVYALVDRKAQGALGKEEFVVGTWLIDQRLKGRKLPIRVSESVWRSVGVLGAIKVKKAR